MSATGGGPLTVPAALGLLRTLREAMRAVASIAIGSVYIPCDPRSLSSSFAPVGGRGVGVYGRGAIFCNLLSSVNPPLFLKI